MLGLDVPSLETKVLFWVVAVNWRMDGDLKARAHKREAILKNMNVCMKNLRVNGFRTCADSQRMSCMRNILARLRDR